MRILYLTNNAVGDSLFDWLAQENDVTRLEGKITQDDIQKICPDFIISYSYRHIIRKETLDLLPGRFINLHISMLPYNRGADPNAWSILDETPKGVTIHVIDPGLDTGPIIAQRKVSFSDKQTLSGTYLILHEHIQELFKDIWPDFYSGKINPVAQVGTGSFHYAREFAAIKPELFLEDGWNVTLGDLRERYKGIKK